MNTTVQPYSLSQPTFNGYVDKSVIKYVNKATKGVINETLQLANKNHEAVDVDYLKKIKSTQQDIIEKLNKFVERLHPQTYLAKNEYSFFIKNKKLNTTMIFAQDVFYNKGAIGGNKWINLRNPMDIINEKRDSSSKILSIIETFAKGLSKNVNSKEVDSSLFKQYAGKLSEEALDISILGRLKTFFNIRKIDKIADEFGDKTDWAAKFESIQSDRKFEIAKKANIVKRNNEIVKRNNEIVKNLTKKES